MFDINLKLDGLELSSIEEKDLNSIQQWLNSQMYYKKNPIENLLNSKAFYERFLEYYVSECEFFLKIDKKDELVGIIKGRIDFKNPNEVWIWEFVIDEKKKKQGIDRLVLENVLEHF